MAKDTTIELTFDKDLDASTIVGNESAFTVTDTTPTTYAVSATAAGTANNKMKLTAANFNDCVGDLTVEYTKSSGSLKGDNGQFINDFDYSFTPTGLVRWLLKADTYGTDTDLTGIADLSGYLYAGSYSGKLLKWNGTNAWTEVAPQYSSQGITSLLSSGGYIYGGTGSSASQGKLLKWNGTNAWTEVAARLAENAIRSLIAVSGTIYGGTSNTSKLYKFTGSAWTEVAGYTYDGAELRSLVNLSGNIYGSCPDAGSDGTLLMWDGVSGWTTVASETYDPMQSLAVFGGEIYGGSAAGKLFKWNGVDAWTEVAGQYSTEEYIMSLVVYESELYGVTDTSGFLLKWNGVDAWAKVIGQYGTDSLVKAYVFDSSLYCLTDSGKLLKADGL